MAGAEASAGRQPREVTLRELYGPTTSAGAAFILVLLLLRAASAQRLPKALFFIAHRSRRVWLAGCTANPTGAWVIQQARNLGLDFSDQGVRFLIRDRDGKDNGLFDEVFRSEGIRDREDAGAGAAGERDRGALRADR